jgi:hypothetical protein
MPMADGALVGRCRRLREIARVFSIFSEQLAVMIRTGPPDAERKGNDPEPVVLSTSGLSDRGGGEWRSGVNGLELV